MSIDIIENLNKKMLEQPKEKFMQLYTCYDTLPVTYYQLNENIETYKSCIKD